MPVEGKVRVTTNNSDGTRTRNPQIRSLIRYPLRHGVLHETLVRRTSWYSYKVPALLAALAARHRLHVAVRLDFDASAAGDGGAVVVLDAREHDLRAGPAQNVDDGDNLDLFRTIRNRYEDALRFRGSRLCRESISCKHKRGETQRCSSHFQRISNSSAWRLLRW